jgi:hypothetical protein
MHGEYEALPAHLFLTQQDLCIDYELIVLIFSSQLTPTKCPLYSVLPMVMKVYLAEV